MQKQKNKKEQILVKNLCLTKIVRGPFQKFCSKLTQRVFLFINGTSLCTKRVTGTVKTTPAPLSPFFVKAHTRWPARAMLDALGLQALSAAALVVAGECECCVPSFPLQRGPLHTTQYRALAHNARIHAHSAAAPPQDVAGCPSQWWCCCCCTALQAVRDG